MPTLRWREPLVGSEAGCRGSSHPGVREEPHPFTGPATTVLPVGRDLDRIGPTAAGGRNVLWARAPLLGDRLEAGSGHRHFRRPGARAGLEAHDERGELTCASCSGQTLPSPSAAAMSC